MRALFLLTLVTCSTWAQDPNAWSMTCTDTTGLESSTTPAVMASGDPCKRTTITASAPTKRANLTDLALSELTACTVYLNGNPVRKLAPAAILTYEHPKDAIRCPVVPPPDPKVPTATKVANGYRIDCVAPAGTREVRLLIVNTDGTLGSRVATAKACGFVTAAFNPAKQYTIKTVDGAGKLSERSPLVVVK